MRPIPKKMRDQMEKDPFMKVCCFPGCGAILPEWHHVWIYAGRQINEPWAIVPGCTYHHRGKGFKKEVFERISICRATQEDLAKYPKKNWLLEMQRLGE